MKVLEHTPKRSRRWLALAALPLGLALAGCEPVPSVVVGGADAPSDVGPPGPAGPQGPAGPAGQPGVITTVGLNGPNQKIPASSGAYVFAGPFGTVDITATHPRVTGTASASMALVAGSPPQYADSGLCYRPAGGGQLNNFVGSGYTTQYFTTARQTIAASATRVLSPGAYDVGFCIRNGGNNVIDSVSYVSGWVQVTS